MYKFNIESMRTAPDGAQGMRITAANNLVQQTLARHGLLPATEGKPLCNTSEMPAGLNGLLTGYKRGAAKASIQQTAIPAGAEFRHEQFSCEAGSRAYRTYIPATAAEGVTGMVVMLHGCTQNPEDFAIGTGMNTLAEKHRFIVLYPQQSRGDNAQSCWNWFSRGDQQRGRGEPAILAGITRKVMVEQAVPEGRIFVAGLSAGAAMAVIMGETYPDLFCAVGAHSGLSFGAARDIPSAFAAMAGNAPESASPVSDTPGIPTIVFHGSADTTVHPSNGESIASQIMNRADQITIEAEEQGLIAGRQFTRRVVTTVQGVSQMEHWVIEGLGHAWSGGQPTGSYTDVKGPDASAEMMRFFLESSRA